MERLGNLGDELVTHLDKILGATFARERRVAIEAGLSAGELLMSHFRRPQLVKYKPGKDFTTEVDTQSETLIKALIGRYFPSHGFLGEEQGVSGQSNFQWIIDPIDGTFNYTFGLPYFAVSIALVHDGVPLVGVVYDPYHEELFFSQRGGGAWVNTRAARTSDRKKLEDAIVGMDFSYDADERMESLDQIRALIPHIRSFRVLGSAALGLVYVSCGRLDVFFHQELKPWDWAAAALIVKEAGGRLTDIHGGEQRTVTGSQDVLGTNGLVHDELLTVFSSMGM
jgi:myo-inositol-1(or 4)-monophosphatase